MVVRLANKKRRVVRQKITFDMLSYLDECFLFIEFVIYSYG